jgi:hypothetical protein
MSNAKVVWQDPPAVQAPRYHHPEVPVWFQRLTPLAKRPGKWALVLETTNPASANSRVHDLRARRVLMPDGEWEFTSRTREDSTGAVYARYLGPEKKNGRKR